MTIIICTSCNGSGKISTMPSPVDYDMLNNDPWWCKCGQCNGTGRQIEQITYKPFIDEAVL